ncbi:MAG: hypothetical protein WC998_08675 [Candidatus Paceibacterota bacterium]|jgi:hypothetical protein
MPNEEKNVYEEILEDNKAKEKSEESGGESSETSEKEETAQTDKERKITKEDVKELGLSKTFIGKPYEKTLKTVVLQLGKWNTQQSQKLANIEKEFGELKVKLSPKEKKEVEEKVEEELPKMPDPFDDPEGFAKWLDKRDNLTLKKFRKEFEDKLKEQDTRGKISEFEAKENRTVLWEEVESGLHKISGDEFETKLVETVSNEFAEYLEDMEEDEFKEFNSFYHGKPKKLAAEMLRWYKSELYDRTKTPKKEEKQKPKETHEEKVEKLKNKNKTFTASASSSREKFKEDDSDSPYKQIIKEGEERLGEE